MIAGPETTSTARRFFDDPENYPETSYHLGLREELVGRLCGTVRGARVLDAGCGLGNLAVQFAHAENYVTLLDVSPGMLARARATWSRLSTPAEFVLADVHHFLPEQLYDYVLAIGLLAHVPFPDLAIARLASFLRPGGRLLLQYTDLSTFSGILHWGCDEMWRRASRRRHYSLNRLTHRQVIRAAGRAGLREEETVRHTVALPGLRAILPARGLYRLERWACGRAVANVLGANCLVRFRKEAPCTTP
jgi:ubiquinone/menaquinone biosynthesis C-methylase UbiE